MQIRIFLSFIGGFIFIFLGLNNTLAQQTIPVNDSKSIRFLQQERKMPVAMTLLNKVLRYRPFALNSSLKTLSEKNTGDTLLLEFFPDKTYKAVIKQVLAVQDATTGITAQITDTEWGYCFISVSKDNFAIRTELPQTDEYFSIIQIGGKSCLAEQKLSKIQADFLDDLALPLPAGGDDTRKAHSGQFRAAVSENTPVTIDLMVVYTPAAKRWADANENGIDNLIALCVQKANLVMSNSSTYVTINLVHKCLIDYTESSKPNTDLSRITKTDDGFMDEVHLWRSQYNADAVSLLADISSVGGVAWILGDEMGNSANAFSVVRVQQAANYTMIHELGHNMGCAHHKKQPEKGLFEYSYAWRGQTANGSKYSSIMAYETGNYYSDPEKHPRIPYFSNPDTELEGTKIGNATEENCALTIRKTKGLLADYSDELPWMDAFLKDILLSAGTLEPKFNPAIKNYRVNVGHPTDRIDITGITNSPRATITGNEKAKMLAAGDNIFNLVVTEGYGNATKTYTVTVARQALATGISTIAGDLQANAGLWKDAVIEIYDMTGKRVKIMPAEEAVSSRQTTLAQGIYFYVLKTSSRFRKKYKVTVK
jgi:hypothetical protein